MTDPVAIQAHPGVVVCGIDVQGAGRMSATLHAREVRCLDTSCPERAQCRRFLDRATGTDATTGYIATCWQPHGETTYPGFLATTPRPEAVAP